MKTIERLRELEKKATATPWSNGWNDGDDDGTAKEMVLGPQMKTADGRGVVGSMPLEFVYVWDFACSVPKGSRKQAQAQVDAELIAESRNALPALLAVVEAQAAEIAAWRYRPMNFTDPNCTFTLADADALWDRIVRAKQTTDAAIRTLEGDA